MEPRPPRETDRHIRVLLATEDAESAVPLRACLANHPELTIVGFATQVETMLSLAVTLRPDVVVIALLYTVRTSALLRAIPAHAPAFEQIAGRVILVAGIPPEPGRRIAAACGASGYVPHAAIADELPDAVAHVARGGSWPVDDPGPLHRRR